MDEIEFIKRAVGDANIVVDVGAKFGDTCLTWRELWPDAHIHAFEPNPDSYAVLAEKDIQAICMAVLDYCGAVAFNIYNRPGSCSIYPLDQWDGVSLERTTIVQTTTLDAFFADAPHIDFLKIDTEGADLAVLRGAVGLLLRGKIRVICAEFNFWPYFIGQCKHYEIVEFLSDYNMRLVAIFPVYWKGDLRYANAIFSYSLDK